MLTPEQMSGFPDKLVGIYQKLEEFIIGDISRRIAKTAMVTDTGQLQLLILKDLGESNKVIKAEIAKITKLSAAEVEQLFFDTGQISTEFYDNLYLDKGATPISKSPLIAQQVKSIIKQTDLDLLNITQSMGFSVLENGKTVFKPIAKAYQDALNLATMQISSGAVDYTTAVRQATQSLADSGVRFVDYKSGWVNRVDVAVKRATITGLGQLTGNVSEQVAKDLDFDIVEVTAHAGARPSHAEWQGKRFSLSGASKKYPSLTEVTGYGTGAGLKGWNCRHDFYAVNPTSDPVYTAEQLKNIDPAPIEFEGKKYTAYEASQFQRQAETAMRKTKREIIAAESSGDKQEFAAKSIKLKQQKIAYNEFSEKSGLLTQYERAQEINYTRSVAQKAAWAARKGA